MATPILFFSTDVGNTLTFTILNPDGTARDLTNNSSVKLYVEGVTGSPFTCTVTSLTGGTATYTVTASAIPAGSYRSQIKVTYASGNIFSSNIFLINVSTSIG